MCKPPKRGKGAPEIHSLTANLKTGRDFRGTTNWATRDTSVKLPGTALPARRGNTIVERVLQPLDAALHTQATRVGLCLHLRWQSEGQCNEQDQDE